MADLSPCALAAGVILACASAQAQDADESAALRRFRQAFGAANATADNLEAKREALRGVRQLDSPKVAKALIDAYNNLEDEVGPLQARRHAHLLAGGGTPRLGPLRQEVQPIHNLQGEILKSLRRLRQPATVERLVEAFLEPRRKHPFALRLTLAATAGALPDGGVGLVTRQLRRKSEEDRVLLCRALASIGRRAAPATPWLLTQLGDKAPAVRTEAIRALAHVCSPQSLEPLIGRLDVEEGRMRDLVAQTLESLTGAKPGVGAHSWRLWLQDVGKSFLSGERPLRDPGTARAAQAAVQEAAEPEVGRRKGGRGKDGRRKDGRGKAGRGQDGRGQDGRGNRRGGQGPGPAAAQKGTGSYFGIPQDGQSILYVFDNSNSMKAKMERGGETETRMDRCRKELHKALDGLTPNKTFNLTCFANRLRWFETRMLPATRENIQRAHAWVDRVQLELETNTYDSLEHAFLIAGRGTTDRHYPVVADTIFFLSDGAPTIRRTDGQGRGLGRDDIDEILAAVQRWNPLGRVVIHSIGLGVRGGGPRAFLEKLAQQNGGRYVQPQ